MDSSEGIVAQVRQFMLKTFPLARKRALADDDSLLESGIVDSMGVLEIVSFLEDEFHITPTDEEMLSDNFESVCTISNYIEQKMECNSTS